MLLNTGSPKNSWSRQFTWHFLRLCIPLVLVLAVVLWLLHRTEVEAALAITQASEKQSIQLAGLTIDTVLGVLRGDALYLAEHSSLQQWLNTGDPAVQAHLSADFLAFARHRERYDQVSFLDEQGQEVVRINWNHGQPTAVPTQQLQGKLAHYYVQNTLALNQNAMLMSPFDLNIEQGVIEQPIKPTIRFSAPVFDNEGRKRGLIVINYLGQRLLNRLRAISKQYDDRLWLLNAEGYWLMGSRPEMEWGFMYPDRQMLRFDREYGEAMWSSILRGAQRDQWEHGNGLFTYAKITPVEAQDIISDNHWILATYLPTSVLATKTADYARNLVMGFMALSLLLALFSGVIANHVVRRQQAEDGIRASEDRFRRLLNLAPDAIVIMDRDGHIILVNAQAEQWFGYTRDELVGQPIDQLVSERFRDRYAINWRRYLAKPAIQSMGLELYGRRNDGSEFPVEINLSPMETDQGLLVTSIIRNITARKENERKIQQLNSSLRTRSKELEVINKELEAFSYSVSHDLRTPLRAMDGFSRLLLDEYAECLDNRGQDRLRRIRAAAQRMAALIDDLLKLSRVARTDLAWESVDLTQLANEIMEGLRQDEPERIVHFSVQPGLIAPGDARLLRVVMDNLLGNAWKFTNQQSEAIIEVGCNLNGKVSIYSVRDNGAGFDMAYADKLFGAFQRLHDADEFSGTGIGLATVQRVIYKHGGCIWAESVVGQGANFYFTLNEKESA